MSDDYTEYHSLSTHFDSHSPSLPYPPSTKPTALASFTHARRPGAAPYHRALITLLEHFWPRELFGVHDGAMYMLPGELTNTNVIYVTTLIFLRTSPTEPDSDTDADVFPHHLPVLILEAREPSLFESEEDRAEASLKLRQRLEGYSEAWPGTPARTPSGAPLSAIPGLYGGVAYGLHHLAPFLMDNKTQAVQPSLDGGNPPNTNVATVKIQFDQSDSNGNESDTLLTHQFGSSLLDPAGFKTMAAIAERTVGWLRDSGVGSEELLEKWKAPYAGGIADDGLPFGSKEHLPRFLGPLGQAGREV